MDDGVDELTVVVPEQHWGDVTWSIMAGWQMLPGIGPSLMTVAKWETPDSREMAGFGGEPLQPGSAVNAWRGSSSGLPDFVLVRSDADVASVIAVENNGQEHTYPMTAVIGDFGLRFGGMPISPGLVIDRLRVTTTSGVPSCYSQLGKPLRDMRAD